MNCVLTAGVTEFIELNFALNKLLVLASPVIYSFTAFASEFYKLVLWHSFFILLQAVKKGKKLCAGELANSSLGLQDSNPYKSQLLGFFPTLQKSKPHTLSSMGLDFLCAGKVGPELLNRFAPKYSQPRLTVALWHVPPFESLRKQSSLLAPGAQLKNSSFEEFFNCAPGRIRTFEARRREIYSLLWLTTPPPTHMWASVSFPSQQTGERNARSL